MVASYTILMYFQEHYLYISFLLTLCIILGDLFIKLDPKIRNLINKTTIEKELFNTKITIQVLLGLFVLQTVWIELDNSYLVLTNHWTNLINFWLSATFMLFFLIAYLYYTALYKILRAFNFSSLVYLPTLNIYKILPSEYFTFISLLYGFLTKLINTNDIIFLYIIFEITNINIYCILGISQGSPKASEAAVKYYFISLMSSLFCLWGVSYIYGFTGLTNYKSLLAVLFNMPFHTQSSSIPVLIGLLFIILSFFIKLGIFPCHSWVPAIYELTLNFTFLLLMTVVKLGFYLGMLHFIINLIIKTSFSFNIFRDLFSLVAVCTTLFGSLLLITRTTVKGFLTANSILSWGILLLSVTTNFKTGILWKTHILLFHWNLQYIIIYITIIFIVFNLWLNWYLYIYWSKILNYFYYKSNWVLQLFSKFYQNNYLKTTWNIYQITNLTTLYYIFKKYDDSVSIVFIWLIGGFPPFILFITKFYIIFYAWSNGLTFTSSLIWLLINTLGIYGYIKGISLFIMRYKKETY